MKYPNLELYKDLKPCEDDLWDLINKNFLIIDSFWALSVVDIVEELPLGATQGDTYIVGDEVAVFDGLKWLKIPLKDGMLFYLKSESDFYYYDGELKPFTARYGDVAGPESSLRNSVAVFDSETGKFITDSGVLIENETSLVAENVYTENTIAGNVYAEDVYTHRAFISSSLVLGSEEVELSGEDQEIPLLSAVQIVLTGSSLVSVASISNNGNTITLINKTTNPIVIKNGLGILTGNGDNIELEIDAALLIQRVGDDWYIIGGTGGGGGKVKVKSVSANYTALKEDDAILVNTTSSNVTVTLLDPAEYNKRLSIKKLVDDGTLIISGGTSTIDGQPTIEVYNGGNAKTLISNGSEWFTI